MPLSTIMIAAKTVSRAVAGAPSGAESMIETISATSITVTAAASTIEPKGSPTRSAMTSAWWTAAKTAPPSRMVGRRRTIALDAGTRPENFAASSAAAATGAAQHQSLSCVPPARGGGIS